MKRKFFGLALCLCLTLVFFVGCSGSSPFSVYKAGAYSTSLTDNTYVSVDASNFQKIADAYDDITLSIITNRVTNNNGEITETFSSSGSGFVVYKGASGIYIATNSHVVNYYHYAQSSYKLYVSTAGENDKFAVDEIVWYNENLDIAIIYCSAASLKDLPAAKLKDRWVNCTETEKLKALDEVIAIGTPIDLEYYSTITKGEISSNLRRFVSTTIKNPLNMQSSAVYHETMIQHTAPINHGNSGGPLIDEDGFVVGINTAGDDDAHSMFFATAIYPVMIALDSIVEKFETEGSTTTEIAWGFYGYDRYTCEVFDLDFDQDGVCIESLQTGCIIAELAAGDIITKISFNENDYIIKLKDDLMFARLYLLDFTGSGTVTVLRNNVETELNFSV